VNQLITNTSSVVSATQNLKDQLADIDFPTRLAGLELQTTDLLLNIHQQNDALKVIITRQNESITTFNQSIAKGFENVQQRFEIFEAKVADIISISNKELQTKIEDQDRKLHKIKWAVYILIGIIVIFFIWQMFDYFDMDVRLNQLMK
jgi:hypothetical protein